MKKKKVLMVHNFYQIGGGEHTVFKNEVDLLRQHGHEVIEYTRNNSELKQNKLKLVLLPFTTIWSWKTYNDIRRIIRDNHIDIVHCHNTFPLISPSVYYAARSMKVPVIQTVHNFRLLCPNGSFFCDGKICEKCNETGSFRSALQNNCYRNSKIQTLVLVAMLKFHRWIGTYQKISYIFLTKFNREKFSKLIDVNSEQVFIKPNFVKESNCFVNTVAKKTFVYAGRLEVNKGILSLIEMWKTLPEDFALHIFGGGTMEEHIKKEIKSNKNISFFGFKPQKEVFEDYRNAVAAIIPSEWYETFGMGIPECFSMKLPVICTDIGNPGEMVKESKGGLVYPIGDLSKFQAVVKEMIEMRQVYSENAYQYYLNNLTDEKNYKELVEIYDKSRNIK